MNPGAWTWLVAVLVPSGADSQPASQPTGRVVLYQPGVRINWSRKQVEIDSTVVLREGLLELFACSPGTREHESILRVNCRCLHIYQALGLIGLRPGTPPAWDAKANKPIAATGDRVDVFVRYESDGRTKEVHACDWMLEGDKVLSPRWWVFAGSFRTEDGRFAADPEGTAVTVVDFPEALLSLPEAHTSDNEQLWLSARTDRIPPLGTSCTLVLRAAEAAVWQISLDRFGRMRLGGEFVSRSQLGAQLAEKLDRGQPLSIELRVDESVSAQLLERTVKWLKEMGIRPKQIRVRRNGSVQFPQHDAQAGVAFLKRQMHDPRALLERLAQSPRKLGGQILQGVHQLDQIGRRLHEYLQGGEEGFPAGPGSSR